MTINRILVPLDGSAESNAALPLARTLARALGASVTLLRVNPPPEIGDRATSAEAVESLRKIAAELASSDIQVNSIVRYGNPAGEILAEIRAMPVSLIVMRTHGRAGVERAVLGSTTERVLKHSGVPLVLLRAGGKRIMHISRLLVPVDGSPGGAVALSAAVPLARRTEATIKLLQLTVPASLQMPAAYEFGGMSYFDPTWDEEALASATTYVEAVAARLRSTGVQAEGSARLAADVAQSIATTADSEDADLIVMSTQALTGPARALLGSVADAVVRCAPCPVLLVHRVRQSDQSTDSQLVPEPLVTSSG
jgi:nucleotide-binding universal stress UspA family protein